MISRRFPLTLAAIMFAPALSHAQQHFPVQPLGSQGQPYGATFSYPEQDFHLAMHEDIEIFRRILGRKLQPLYLRTFHAQTPSGMDAVGIAGGGIAGMMAGMGANPNFTTVWQQEIHPTLEGVYLRGHGIVYTATLSSLQPPKSYVKVETRKPVSEWESVRREVRNEKEKPKTSAPSKPLELSDLLLQMLAENGQHFSRLGADESLTIVLTVREKDRPAPARKTAVKPAKSSQAKTTNEEIPHSSVLPRDWDVLGDLHMKHGRYEDAIEQYKKLVELKYNPKSTYRKLAQCYLALENTEKAQSVLEQLAAHLKKETGEGKEKLTDKSALPVKLIVSVPKKLLDQVGEKKMSFEEFRRRVRVEKRTFETRSR